MDGPTGIAHRLVGRTAELRRLESVVQAGEGLRLALVGGEAGIGKTRLIDESLACALTSSLVLRLRGDADRRSRPFEALLGALWPIVGEWTDLPSPLAARADAMRELLGPVAPGLDPGHRTLGTDVLERAAVDLLRHLTPDPAPLVMVADDLHWIDPESVGVLQQVVAGVAGLDDAVLLGTYRPDGLLARSPLSALVTTVERRPDGLNLRLDRLTLDEVADFAAQVLGEDVPYRAVKALHHRSGGNPFFLEELLAVAAEAGVHDIADLPLPWTVTELLRDSVMALSPDERTVVESAAVLGQRVPFDLLAKVTRLDEDALIVRLRGVVASGLLVEEDVDVFSFRHAIVREAIAESLLGRERRRVHEVALAVLSEEDDPDPAAIAHHAQGAGRIDEMLAAVRRAAVDALACGAPHRALEFAEMGLAEAPDDLVLDEVATRAAWLIGALDDALEHGTRWANAAVDPADESKARRVLMRVTWEARDALAQRREIDRLRGLVDLLEPGEARAALLADLAQAHMLSKRKEEAIEWADRAMAEAEAVGAERIRVQAIVERVSALTMLGHDSSETVGAMLAAADAAEALGDHFTAARAIHNITDQLPVGQRRQAIERMRVNAEAAGSIQLASFDYAASLAGLASLNADRGELDRWLDYAWRWNRLRPISKEAPWMRFFEAVLEQEASDPGDVVARGFRVTPATAADALGPEALSDLLAAARAGDTDAARDAMHRWLDAMRADRCDASETAISIEAALRAGIPPGEAAELAATSAQLDDEPAMRSASLAFIALAQRDAPRAVELMAAVGDDVEGWLRGELHLQLAELALADDVATAQRELEIATDLLARWPGWRRDRADAMARRLERRTSSDGDSQLSSRELEVAALLAEGLTNAQIAERLFIARKTAAVHVSNILAKLGMRSRAEIAAWAVRQGVAGSGGTPARPGDRRAG